MTITSTTLLVAADEMAKAERARAWLALFAGVHEPSDDLGIHVGWSAGKDVEGYDDIRAEVALLFSGALRGWIETAVHSLESRAIAAVRDLSTPVEPPADLPTGGARAFGACFSDNPNQMCDRCSCWKRTRADCS